ncbi:MAG: DUF2384 domain-containing protein [Rhodoferax sp.]|nr:DUF2384 domain-containing protein [Rhodoferax sp.]
MARSSAERWLAQPAIALNECCPIDLISTTPGIEAIKELLTRMEHGVRLRRWHRPSSDRMCRLDLGNICHVTGLVGLRPDPGAGKEGAGLARGHHGHASQPPRCLRLYLNVLPIRYAANPRGS